MPKEYFCKVVTNNIICGENDSENFEKGRYSSCKKCRVKIINGKKIIKKNVDLAEKVNKIDPKGEIQDVVEYQLKCKDFLDGYSLFENFLKITEDHKGLLEKINTEDEIKEKLSQNFSELKNNYDQVRVVFKAMKERLEDLEADLLNFKRKIDIDTICERLKSLENYRRDSLDEKNQKSN